MNHQFTLFTWNIGFTNELFFANIENYMEWCEYNAKLIKMNMDNYNLHYHPKAINP